MAVLPKTLATRQQVPYYFLACMLLVGAFAAAQYVTFGTPVQWLSLAILPLAVWSGWRWYQMSTKVKTSQMIKERLARLPSDFAVLHDLVIPAPWGANRIDHLLISRFGIVVIADGPTSHWMTGQVEAIRSLLVSRGLANASVPIRALVLLPMGTSPKFVFQWDAPVVRVDLIELSHIAPSRHAVLDPKQMQWIIGHLSQIQQVA